MTSPPAEPAGPGGQARPPTVHDVARASGVSTATVSRVLAGKKVAVAPETALRVAQAARALDYRPSEIGRSLQASTSRIVVLLVPDVTNYFCADVAISVQQAVQGAGLSMVLGNAIEDAARQDELLAEAEAFRPSAIVLLGAIDTPALRALAARFQRLVFVNRRPPPCIAAPYVGIDHRDAGRVVAEHFLGQGYLDVATIHGSLQHSASRERLDGFLRRFAEAGVAERVVQIESPLTTEAGYQHGRALLAATPRPRAVFCGNDMIAYGVYRAAADAGVAVPHGLAICGFDDNRLNAWLAPWLTTVHVPALEFGAAVVSILDARGETRAGADVILPFALRLRSSA